jgi:CRISPR-associated protein Cas2
MKPRWIVAYDIVDDRRRYRVERILSGYGWRLQYSAFECAMDEGECEQLVKRLTKEICLKADRIHAWPLCAWCHGRVKLLGNARRAEEPPDFLMV